MDRGRERVLIKSSVDQMGWEDELCKLLPVITYFELYVQDDVFHIGN